MSKFSLKATFRIFAVGILLVASGVPMPAHARMDYVNGNDSIEGDPGDGLETIGGGSGTSVGGGDSSVGILASNIADWGITISGTGEFFVIAVYPVEFDGMIRFVLVSRDVETDWGQK